MARRYELCGYLVDMVPAWELCGRPVEAKRGTLPRCPEHKARLLYWPAGAGRGP